MPTIAAGLLAASGCADLVQAASMDSSTAGDDGAETLAGDGQPATGPAGDDEVDGVDGTQGGTTEGPTPMTDTTLGADGGTTETTAQTTAEATAESTGQPSACGPQMLCHGAAVTYDPMCSQPRALGFGDFDEQGDLDVVVACENQHVVSVLLGDGTGGLTHSSTTDLGMSIRPVDLVVTDIDGDDNLDVVTANRDDSSVAVLYGDGGGTLTIPDFYDTGSSTRGVAAGDVNDDGLIDILAAVRDDNNISVFYNDTMGSLMGEVEVPSSNNRPESVFAAELDDQPGLDAAWSSEQNDLVVIHFGDGEGALELGITVAAGSDPAQLSGGDFDGDGDVDLVVSNRMSDDVSYIENNGDGTFTDGVAIAVGEEPRWVAVGDLDADGALDIVTADRISLTLSVLLGDGAGEFLTAPAFMTTAEPNVVGAADLNGDGVPEIVYDEGNLVAVIPSEPR
ncbi:MAG: VCBS repeat-containing protein [Myxococcota bacterium]